MPRQYRQKTLHKNWKSLLNLLSSVKNQPTILCGDLNLTPHNTLYDTIIHNYGYFDAHQSGYGFTFPNAQRKISVLGTLIRIDYLLSKNLIAYNTQTVNASRLSDHRSVITHYKKQ